jgi:LasA protease
MLPDSEVVYGPPAAGFDVERFAQSQSGYLKEHEENVEGRVRTGPEIVQLVAQRYSVSPRVLLALIELKGGWLSNPAPSDTAKTYPTGRIDPARPRLYYQLTWAANQINEGYYGWKSRQLATLTYQGGSRAKLTPGLNPGTYGLQFMLAQLSPPDGFLPMVAREGEFMQVYLRLFGDPASRAVEPLLPPDLKQPEFKLPWPAGDRWFFTGGPHGAWGSGSAWAALDFIPGTANLGGCWDASAYWVTAVAAGVVVRSEDGEVMVDLDGDGKETTGWNILYMHVASRDRVAVGTRLKTGDRIGHPSCEGGFSTGTHLHVVRKYNGEWVPASGPIPFTLSGWTVTQGGQEYDGAMSRAGETREACECRVEETNGLLSDNR